MCGYVTCVVFVSCAWLQLPVISTMWSPSWTPSNVMGVGIPATACVGDDGAVAGKVRQPFLRQRQLGALAVGMTAENVQQLRADGNGEARLVHVTEMRRLRPGDVVLTGFLANEAGSEAEGRPALREQDRRRARECKEV